MFWGGGCERGAEGVGGEKNNQAPSIPKRRHLYRNKYPVVRWADSRKHPRNGIFFFLFWNNNIEYFNNLVPGGWLLHLNYSKGADGNPG